MPNLIQQQWRFNPVCCIHWWNNLDEYVIFNAASGKTHFLTELSAHTLKLLATEPMNREELINRFGALYEGFVLDDDVLTYIKDMLQNLEEQGLIESIYHETG